MKKVFVAQNVLDVKECLGDVLNSRYGQRIIEYITSISDRVWSAYLDDDRRILPIINNYHPDFLSMSWGDIKQKKMRYDQIQDACAFYFSYEGIAAVPDGLLDVEFERAVDLLLSGELTSIKEMIEIDARWLERRSQYGHNATLWHYLGSNGVELHRQVVPLNLAQMISTFLQLGVDTSSTMKIYGGYHTMEEMLKTSVHPKLAGVHEICVQILNDSMT